MVKPQEQSQQLPELTDYLRVLRDRAWIISLAVVVVVAAMLLNSLTSAPLYQASSKLLYERNNLDKALFGVQYFLSSDQTLDVATGAEMVELPQVAEAVKEQLHSSQSAGALLGMVDVSSSAATNIIRIDVVSTTAQEAADVANAFAQQFIILRRDNARATVAAAQELVKQKLDTLSPEEAGSTYGLSLKQSYEDLQILEAMQDGGFVIVQTAVPPAGPFAPRPLRSGLLGLAGGLVLGFGLALLLNRLDRRLKDVKAVEAAFGLPVLATFPAIGRWRRGRNLERRKSSVGFRSHPMLLEPFRALRSSLQYFGVEKRIKTILISSGLPQEGKTTTTINLALSLALAGGRVVIVEADLRRPMVAQYLHVDTRVGISNVLAGGVTFADALRPVNADAFLPEGVVDKAATKGNPVPTARTLFCLASGPLPPNPAELLSSERMAQLLDEMSRNPRIDYVLIDTPPILSVTDALTIAQRVDAVIVACRANWTTREEAEEVSEQFRRTGARVIGVVASGIKTHSRSYHRRSYYSTDNA
ncbi:MAG: AAA family ATPase [Armatimonadetes bacterium]|nr:AAA family ATPase [Armatimonadota bacterium]